MQLVLSFYRPEGSRSHQALWLVRQTPYILNYLLSPVLTFLSRFSVSEVVYILTAVSTSAAFPLLLGGNEVMI